MKQLRGLYEQTFFTFRTTLVYWLIINQRAFEVVTVYFEAHGNNTTSVSPEVTYSAASTPTHYDKGSVTF